MSKQIDQLLDQLDEAKLHFGERNAKKILAILGRLKRSDFDDAQSLVRFHELLLFLRAYPEGPLVRKTTESLLQTFGGRVRKLAETGTDISSFEPPEVSGIAGTSVSDTFTFNITRWLVQKHSSQLSFDWDWFEDENRLAETWPRFMPLLEEDAFVEANVPYVAWLRSARARMPELPWLINRFERLPLTDDEKSELYDSQKLYLRWRPAYGTSRTGMRLPVRKIFYHRDKLIARRDVQFREELLAPPTEIFPLSRKQGRQILDMARETSTLRYRELYGFTHGDESRVLRTNLGRGVDLFLCGLPSARRLPIRAYHAAMIFKNGVPVGYFEGLSLFERMESGFNFYYGFREGETAWIYARTLNVFHHLLGVSAFSLDPYQIGFENEEGIESGAFWFYRKLGFRPVRKDLFQLTEKEELKIATRKDYRTPARALRKLAQGPMIFELNNSSEGDWDGFSVRSIGLRVQRQMASRHRGDAMQIREQSAKAIIETLEIRRSDLNDAQLKAVGELALVLNLIPDFKKWVKVEQKQVARIVLAKAGRDESTYLRLMQRHARLRKAIITLGSK
ncbi:MAG TPA: hypothetical protein VIV66_23075 [Pyrinomonadaceae bacterium]